MKIRYTVVTVYEVEYPYVPTDTRDDDFNAACKEIREHTDVVIARSTKIRSAIDSVSEHS